MTDIFDFSRMMEAISLPVDDEQPLAYFQHGISAIMVIDKVGISFIRSLPSLMPQKFLREIIIVDLGAPEELLSCINKISQEFPIVRLISNKKHLSKTQALNMAAKRAYGKYLMFVEQHAVLPKDATVKIVVGFANRGDVPAIVGAQVQPMGGQRPNHQLLDPKEATLAALGMPPKDRYREVEEQYAIHVGGIEPGCFIISRANFWAFEGFDSNLGDFAAVKDLCLKMHIHGGGVYLAKECPVNLYPQPSKGMLEQKGLIKYYYKHFRNSPSRRWLMPLAVLLWLKGLRQSIAQFFQRKDKKNSAEPTLQELLKQEPLV